MRNLNRFSLALMLIVVLIVLAGCSERSVSFQGQIEAVNDNIVIIDCSEEVNKGKKNVNSIGHGCGVNLSNDTIIRDVNGELITTNDLPPGTEVKVVLANAVNFQKVTSKSLQAKEIIVVKKADPIILYDFRRHEVVEAKVYHGSPDSDPIIAEISDPDQLDKLAAILQDATPFSGNATADWNYTIVIETTSGEQRDIEISGGVSVFSDRSAPQTYSLDKEKFLEYIAEYE